MNVQRAIQAAVIEALIDDPNLDIQRIVDDFNGRADLRDVLRAMELLTSAGLIELAPEGIRQPGALPMLFTDAGLRSLRGEVPWPIDAGEQLPQTP
jgi:hypothetical protein